MEELVFLDENQELISIGNIVKSEDSEEPILIISIGYHNELNQIVMYGQFISNSAAFAILTRDILSEKFKKI